MTEQNLPAWQKDPLSTFFADAEFNERVTALKLAPQYDMLRSLDGLFRRVEEAIENDNRRNFLLHAF